MNERKKGCGGVGDVLMRSATSNVDVEGNRASRACLAENQPCTDGATPSLFCAAGQWPLSAAHGNIK